MQRRKGKTSECRVQRIAKKDKKGLSCEQCKEIEGKIHGPESLTKMGPQHALTKM